MVFLEIFKWICAFIDHIIYELIVNTYVLFAAMCEMNIDSIGTKFKALTERIEVFLGIIMLFIVAFSILQAIVEPDKAEKATSELVKKIGISIVLLISMQFVFGLFNELQTLVIDNGLIEKIILGNSSGDTGTQETEGASEEEVSASNYSGSTELTGYEKYVSNGKYFSYNLFFAFITVPENLKDAVMGTSGTPSKTLYDVVNEINSDGVYYRYPIVSGIVGILLGVMFFTFAVDIGVRAFSLMLLQVIAPIPIIGYIAPGGDKILDKYFKEYMSAFIELFVKIATIYITLYLMQYCIQAILLDIGGSVGEATTAMFPNLGQATGFFRVLLLVTVFVALFYFSKKFPKLLGTLFGLKFESSINPFAAATGVMGGAIGGLVGGAAAIGSGAGFLGGVSSIAKGMGTGYTSGSKAKSISDFVSGSVGKNFTSQRKNNIDLGNKGGVGGSVAQKLNSFNQRKAAVASTNLATINKGEELRSAVNSEADKKSLRALGYDDRGSYIENALNTDARYNSAQAALELERNSAAGGRTDAQRQADLAAKMSAVQSEKQRATRAATTYLDVERDRVRDADIAAKTGPVYAKAVEYQSHATQNSGLYKGHTPLDGSGAFTDDLHSNLDGGAGIRTGQQQIINETSSNAVARGAGAAQTRGAINAAKHKK